MRERADLILNAVKHDTSNGRVEGLNTKVRLIIRRTYGFHSADAAFALDTGRAERARIEMDLVLAELTAGTGLGGRQREAGKSAERARKAVSTRIADVLSRIEKVHPPLARHLRISLRTGTICAYEPERPTLWTTRD